MDYTRPKYTIDEKGINFASDFKWWDAGNVWWKIYPPIVVGTHGQAVTFSQEEGLLSANDAGRHSLVHAAPADQRRRDVAIISSRSRADCRAVNVWADFLTSFDR